MLRALPLLPVVAIRVGRVNVSIARPAQSQAARKRSLDFPRC
jgi:hypothetical protein